MTTYAAAAVAKHAWRSQSTDSGDPPEVALVSSYPITNGDFGDVQGGVDGTVTGTWTSTSTPSLVTGDSGTSIFKDNGAGAYATLPASNALHDLNELSLAIYYQPTAGVNKHTIIAAHTPSVNTAGDFSIERLTNGRLRAWHIGQDGGLRFFESTDGIAATNLAAGTAYRIVLTLGPAGAKLYLDDDLAASIPENSNGWNNTVAKYVGIWTDASSSPMIGAIDQISIWSGQLELSGVTALPAAKNAVIAIADNAGDVTASATTDVDVAANDSKTGGLALTIAITSDPSSRLSVINNGTVNAQVRITAPAAPTADTNESGAYTLTEGGVTSNAAAITWRRPKPTGSYTPFAFVTNYAPAANHTGITSRPSYSASNPQSASFVDPMSGLTVFRITGTRGSTVFINGTVDSGLQFPSVLKGENNPRCQRAFNADSTLLMLSESKSTSADSALTDPACRSVLIDISGSHGNSGPWRILRAGTNNTLNDTLPSGSNIDVQSWFWDWLDPLRAYILSTTQVFEWWPAGGVGHSVGETNFLFNGPSGFTIDFRGGRAQSSHDGLVCHVPIRRNSDGMRGGIRMNLSTGALGPVVMNPRPPYASSDNELNGIVSTGALGTWCYFGNQIGTSGVANSKHFRTANMVTGDLSATVFDNVMGHSDHMHVDGREYLFGEQGDQWISFDLETGAKRVRLTGDPLSVAHPSCRAFKDTFENHGATGGSTTGLRYALGIRSEGSLPGHIYGIRLGLNDTGVVRFICNHRSKWSNNYNEVHAHVSPDFEYVAFNSNWVEPGVENDYSHVQEYVVLIPDAWRSPNNDGS